MTPLLKHYAKTLEHKWFVFQAGLKTGAPIWRLVIHDWTKFLPSEAPGYARRFFSDKPADGSFGLAWLHHIHHNPHHWEHWILHDTGQAFPMPEWAVREMVADWIGASRAYSGRSPLGRPIYHWSWYVDNRQYIRDRVHSETWSMVLDVLVEIHMNPGILENDHD